MSDDQDIPPGPLNPAGNGQPPPPPSKDARGRFVVGNKAGRGNPLNARVQRIRAELIKSLKPSDARQIAAKLIEMAKGGDMQAIRELLDRVIGKAVSQELLERVEALEATIEGRKVQP